MRRVVSLTLPHLATDRLRRSVRSPLLVTARHDGRKGVIDGATAAARAIGLYPGLPIGEAQARVPDLVVRPADPDAEAAALRRAARLCLRYAPLAAPAPPDGVFVDATGCAHLFGGERRMLARMVDGFGRLGLTARAAIAGTPGAAHAVARHATTVDDPVAVVEPGAEAAALAPLPPDALRLDPATVAALRRLGLDTVALLERTPRRALAHRFGPDPGRRLDQAFGRVDEPIGPVAPPRPIAERRGFVEPIGTADAFNIAIRHLLDAVCGRLDAAMLGARRLELGFERVDGTEALLRIGTARPTRDAAHLARLFAERLDGVDPGLGVEAMRLRVPRTETLRPTDGTALATAMGATTMATAGAASAVAALAPLVDTLANRLGFDRVWQPVPVESDVPERSVRTVAAGANAGAPASAPTGATRSGSAAAAAATWPDALPRPVRLLDPPQPVAVTALLPDHPPASFTWRRVRHRVRHADGPERIAGEWWRRAGEVRAVRDYFRVEDEDGQRFWLFRRGDGTDEDTGDMRWFLHGLF